MNLDVSFSGLCNFVPMYSQGSLQKVWVLLINARDKSQVPGGLVTTGAPVIFEHWAFLRFPIMAVASGAPKDAFGLWDLHECDLEIFDGSGKPIIGPPRISTPTLADTTKPVVAGEETAFHWLGQMEKADVRHGKVIGECLEEVDLKKVPSDRVSARYSVEAGDLLVKKLVMYPGSYPPTPIVWEFEPPATPVYEQALAEELVQSVTVATNDVIFRRTHRTSGNVQNLTLNGVSGKLEVSVMNLEPDGLVGVGEQRRPHRIEEFRWFYRTSPDPNAPFPIPVTEPSAGGNPYCPMAQAKA